MVKAISRFEGDDISKAIKSQILVCPLTGRITRIKTGLDMRLEKKSDGYSRCWLAGKRLYLHRLVWEYFNGLIPMDSVVDHVDGDKENNSLENLRLATYSENAKNKVPSKPNRLGIRGVCECPEGYKAYIKSEKKGLSKVFKSVQDAEDWVSRKREELHNEYSRSDCRP